jgi:1-aminocyclopropane-1-carboxylate deaminase/D-cysteine desulfhydrase-like pyridoxal-dependent ACC family enzyme
LVTISLMPDYLSQAYPRLAGALRRLPLAELPTPLENRVLRLGDLEVAVCIKRDDVSGRLYGGNKVRKLEYLLQRAREQNATRIATFGTVASNHAVATAIYTDALGLDCLCFLSHQSRTASAAVALNTHLHLGTRVVCIGGDRAGRLATLRRHLPGQKTWVIPAGGSCWLGAVGFVNAGLELAAQCAAHEAPVPDRLYVANGTMGTAAGLAVGLALAGLMTEVHAVRVTHQFVANPAAMQRLIGKTAAMLRRIDPSVPADTARRTRVCFRDGFFAGGYAQSDAATDTAIGLAREQLGLNLEATYTGKAMAALVADARRGDLDGKSLLFWNTYSSRALPAGAGIPADTAALPAEFLRYFS